jgi:WD40 repeat protein
VHVSSTLPGDAVTASSSFLSHFDHGSSVLCICRSPSGTLLATGCVDGSVCLWRCSLQSGKADVSLVNMYRIHHSPVLVIEFAVESNLLFSCAADGSVFVVSVDKRHLQKKDPRPPAAKMNDEMVRDAAIVEEGNSMTSRLWQDVHREQLVYTLKEKYVTSIKHVGEAVLTLRNKLDKMLRHNEDCDELERMGTDEFVVDTRTMQRLLEQNDGQVSTLREQYEHDCRKNELIASRLRQVCWDMNESNSKCLLPIQEDLIEALSIWSFPIKKYTDADFIKLEK